MLFENLYQVLQINVANGELVATVRLNEKHAVYAAHFPGNPITPGVIQIQLVKELLEQHFKKELSLVSISRCNFLSILNPVVTPEITVKVSFSENDQRVKANATIESGENIFVKISAVFQ